MFDVEAMSNRDAVAQWTAMLEERVSSLEGFTQYHIDIVEIVKGIYSIPR